MAKAILILTVVCLILLILTWILIKKGKRLFGVILLFCGLMFCGSLLFYEIKNVSRQSTEYIVEDVNGKKQTFSNENEWRKYQQVNKVAAASTVENNNEALIPSIIITSIFIILFGIYFIINISKCVTDKRKDG